MKQKGGKEERRAKMVDFFWMDAIMVESRHCACSSIVEVVAVFDSSGVAGNGEKKFLFYLMPPS